MPDLVERLRDYATMMVEVGEHGPLDLLNEAADELDRLTGALSIAVGNMMNAKFDLECGTTKAFAAGQVEKAIQRARAALTPPDQASLDQA